MCLPSPIQLLLYTMSRYKDDRRLKKDTKAEDDPFKLLGLQQGASASQVRPRHAASITSLRRLHIACFSRFYFFFANDGSGEGCVQEALAAAAPRQEPGLQGLRCQVQQGALPFHFPYNSTSSH